MEVALPLILIVSLGIGANFWHFNRARNILEQWATRNGHHLIEAKYAFFFRGPFSWTTSQYQAVYRVLTQDATGHQRSGWVRCGSWWVGMLSDEAQVRWDD